MAGPVIQVENYRELQRAFRQMGSDVAKGKRDELKKLAEPARVETERLARANITNIGSRWSSVRLGVTQRMIYLVPKARRGQGSKRPNLSPLLLREAYEPAVKSKEGEIRHGLEEWLDHLARSNGF